VNALGLQLETGDRLKDFVLGFLLTWDADNRKYDSNV